MSDTKDFFYFTRKQRNGIGFLLVIIISLQLILYWDDLFYDQPTLSDSEVDTFKQWVTSDSIARYQASLFSTAFPFDPNTASDSVWKKLGLSSQISTRINNYREKGGRFKVKDDLKRIYGIDSAWFEHVRPSINLPERYEQPDRYKRKSLAPKKGFDPNTVTIEEAKAIGVEPWHIKRMIGYREKVKPFQEKTELFKVYGLDSAYVETLLPYVEIDTNLLKRESSKEVKILVDIGIADSIDLLKVRGVGPYTAHNIIQYRSRLGGFVELRQLLEIYGMDSNRYQVCLPQLTLKPAPLKKLNLNTATFKELLKHPYLNYEDVKSIVNFREKTRPFQSIDELLHLEGFDVEKTKALTPYLSVSGKSSP